MPVTIGVFEEFMGMRAVGRAAVAVIAALVVSVGPPAGAGAAPASVAEPAQSPAPAADGTGFSDVMMGSQFYIDVSWLAASGITSGFADGTFRGASPVSRQAMAAFLFRFENYRVADPVCGAGPRKFSDVAAGGFCGPIEWLADSGVASGYPDGTFRPGAAVSRQAMAAFLFRASGQAGSWAPPTAPSFSDVPTSSPFFSEIEWLASTGISTGYADGTFRPGAAVSRQAMAAFLHRLHEQPFNDDGTVWAWGQNALGSLGAGIPANSLKPVRVVGLDAVTSVTDIDLGYGRFVLRSDGTVWSWGDGALAGSQDATDVPVQVAGLSDIISIAIKRFSMLALRSDGTVWAWGLGYYGQLGNGSFQDSATAVQVVGLTDVTALATSGETGYALKSDGTVWAWGYGDDGQLGNGLFGRSAVPVQVTGLTEVISIEARAFTAYAVRADGTLWTWGNGDTGLLGNGSLANSTVPVQVNGLTDVRLVIPSSAGGSVYALRSDGTVWAWGYGQTGQLGNGLTADSTIPVAISGLTDVITITSAKQSSRTTLYALKSDGTVWAWGSGGHGELGNGEFTDSAIPVQVEGLTGVTAVAAGNQTGYALRSDGTVWSWGYGLDGQLGSGQQTDSGVPVQIAGLRNVVVVAGSPGNVFALVDGSGEAG